MLGMTRIEKAVILSLILSALLGVGISVYNKRFAMVKVKIGRFDVAEYPDADEMQNSPRAQININEATVKEIVQFKGIGEVIARRIIDYRSSKGAFRYKEEIKKVKGIGNELYERIKDRISVE